MRLGALAVGDTLAGDGVRSGMLFHLVGADPVDPGRVQAEDLRAQRRGDLGIAVLRTQLGRDLKSAKRLDLVLWRAVPDGVGALEHVVLAAVF